MREPRTAAIDRPTSTARRGTTASVVLRSILDNGPVPRSTVARLTGLSGAAVSRQYTDLARLGLVEERPLPGPRAGVGRPHVPVDVDTGRHVVCGVHIALLHCTYVAADLRGTVLAEERIPHAGTSPAEVLADVGNRMEQFVEALGHSSTPLGVGVAVGGWVDPVRGTIVRHEQLGWDDVPVRDVLERRLGLPVRVESHSRALARAEQLIGHHREQARQSMVHLFVGNAVDAAIATGGTVHHGPRSAAGGVAHLPVGAGALLDAAVCGCGRRGCLQATVAEQTLARHAAATGLVPAPSFAALLDRLESGDRDVHALFRDRARLVGRAVALLLDVINPEILVVTEAGVARCPDLLDELRGEVAARSAGDGDPSRTVVATSFGTRVLGIAAGSIVLDDAYTRPLALGPAPT